MKKIILLIITIFIISSHFINAQNKPKVVLLPLESNGRIDVEKEVYQAAIEEALLMHYQVFSGSKVIEKYKYSRKLYVIQMNA